MKTLITANDEVWYKQKLYKVVLVLGSVLMLRREKNPSDVRYVSHNLVMKRETHEE